MPEDLRITTSLLWQGALLLALADLLLLLLLTRLVDASAFRRLAPMLSPSRPLFPSLRRSRARSSTPAASIDTRFS